MILNDASAQQNLLRRWAEPAPDEAPSFSAWSAAKALGSGLFPMAGLEVAGSWADLLSGFATPYAATFAEDTAARKKMLTEGSFDFSAGNALRAKADTFGADPMTSHRADVVLNGLGRVVGKATAYLGTMGGIPGAVAFGADEGNTAAQRLMEQGVDPGTAAQIGGVTGGVSAASALIPVAGKTALETLGLIGVSGPGLYMAQESLAKHILQEYPQEAATHDPTDLLGLALSIAVPSIAGGLHMHAAKSEAKLKTEATLTPAEQAHSDAFERSDANVKELRQAIAAEKNPDSKKLLEAELEKQTTEAKAHAGEAVKSVYNEEAVDSARVRVAEEQLQRDLPERSTARAEVMRAADELGAGETPLVAPTALDIPEVPNITGKDLVGLTYDELDALHTQAAQRNRMVNVEGIRKFFGDEQAKQAEGWSLRKQDGWLEKQNLPTEVDDWLQARYINDELIAEHRNAVNDFDVESPQALGRSIAIRAKGIDEPGFFETPEGVAVASAMRFAKERGWDLNEVLTSMRGRAAEWAGNDAPELFARMFKPAEGGPPEIPKISQPARQQPTVAGRNSLPEASLEAPKPTPLATSEQSAAVQSLAKQMPELRVSIPGHEPMKLTDALETAKAEADEIKSFGDLIRAAVQCALQNGLSA